MNVDRQSVHDFLNMLIDGQSNDEQISILKDIMVEFCFKGLADDKNLANLEREICEKMKKDPSKKVSIIKETREATGLGLKEAKELVESLTPGHPTYGFKPNSVSNFQQSMLTDRYLEQLGGKLNQLAKDYGKPEPF